MATCQDQGPSELGRASRQQQVGNREAVLPVQCLFVRVRAARTGPPLSVVSIPTEGIAFLQRTIRRRGQMHRGGRWVVAFALLAAYSIETDAAEPGSAKRVLRAGHMRSTSRPNTSRCRL